MCKRRTFQVLSLAMVLLLGACASGPTRYETDTDSKALGVIISDLATATGSTYNWTTAAQPYQSMKIRRFKGKATEEEIQRSILPSNLKMTKVGDNTYVIDLRNPPTPPTPGNPTGTPADVNSNTNATAGVEDLNPRDRIPSGRNLVFFQYAGEDLTSDEEVVLNFCNDNRRYLFDLASQPVSFGRLVLNERRNGNNVSVHPTNGLTNDLAGITRRRLVWLDVDKATKLGTGVFKCLSDLDEFARHVMRTPPAESMTDPLPGPSDTPAPSPTDRPRDNLGTDTIRGQPELEDPREARIRELDAAIASLQADLAPAPPADVPSTSPPGNKKK